MSDPSTAIAIIGFIFSANEQRSARKARQRAAERREEIQKQRNFRRKQQELRKARAARARAVAQGTASGAEAAGTSTVQGTTASIQSQAASNISFLDELNRQGAAITDLTQEANEADARANLFGEIAGRGSEIQTIFDEVTTTQGTTTTRSTGGGRNTP